jgi:sortase A
MAPPLSREESYRQLLAAQAKQHLRRYQRRVRLRWARERTRSRAQRLFPAISLTVGSLLLANAIWPIASYFIFTSPDLVRPQLVSALPDNMVVRQSNPTAAGVVQAATADRIQPKIIQDDLDYTNLSNWFPKDPLPANTASTKTQEYHISIPSVNIQDAVVEIGGSDLNHSLIHYPGTANPGEPGSPVIFGHSTLRQFYNPSEKNPRRYYSIFSKIMTLKTGDTIIVEYDNIRYTYKVIKKIEVKPEDTYILEQEYAARQLKLITCVPEGTYLRRGVILAQLEDKTDTIQP